jgi:single-strand DNA-binding protein
VGRIGKAPELKTFDSGAMLATLSIATSESYRDKTSGQKKEVTEWHNVVAWRQLAEIISKYCKKGDLIYVEGKLTTRSWEKNGETRYMTEVIASNIHLIGGSKSPAESPAQNQNAPKPQPESYRASDYTAFGEPINKTSTDELPF